MGLRDLLLKNDPSLQIVFPCTHNTQCPMLKSSNNDWCHGSLNWTPPHLIRQLDECTGFNKHRIKYSASIFSKAARQTLPNKNYRVVAPPEKSKRGESLLLCGGDFYGVSTVSKKERSENNIEFRRAEHFDLLTLTDEGTVEPEIMKNFNFSRTRAL
jgi:ribosomal protein RSM22 (predicted rRNA methylase)